MNDIQNMLRRQDFRFSTLQWSIDPNITLDEALEDILPHLTHYASDIPKKALRPDVIFRHFPRKDIARALLEKVESTNTVYSRNALAFLICFSASTNTGIKKTRELVAALSDDEFFDVMRVSFGWDGISGLNLLECMLRLNRYHFGSMKKKQSLDLLTAGATVSRIEKMRVEPLVLTFKFAMTAEQKALDVAFTHQILSSKAIEMPDRAPLFEALCDVISAHARLSDKSLRLHPQAVHEWTETEFEYANRIEFHYYVFDVCENDVPLSENLLDCLSAIDDEEILKTQKRLRSVALKNNQVVILKQFRKRGWFDFTKVKQDRGFTFPNKIATDTLDFVLYCLIEDHTEQGTVNIEALMATLVQLPKSASKIIGSVIAVLGEDTFFENLKSVNVLKKLMKGTELSPLDALYRVKNDKLKQSLMPMLME